MYSEQLGVRETIQIHVLMVAGLTCFHLTVKNNPLQEAEKHF